MNLHLLRIVTAVALGATLACAPAERVVRVATTTSVENSGLLAAALPEYERQAGIKIEVVAVGSGQALNLVERGDASVGLTHDPAAETTRLAAGTIAGYRKIMFNDFLIVGPAEDPAGIGDAANAGDAFARIAASGAAFTSRGDASGTFSREQQLWQRAGRRPGADRLLETGQGMGGTLRVASERRAYTLTDRATFEQFRATLRLVPLYEGGAELLNTYAVFVRAAATGEERQAADALADWLSNGSGRAQISRFTANGRPVFHPWPPGAARDEPSDVPPAEDANAR